MWMLASRLVAMALKQETVYQLLWTSAHCPVSGSCRRSLLTRRNFAMTVPLLSPLWRGSVPTTPRNVMWSVMVHSNVRMLAGSSRLVLPVWRCPRGVLPVRIPVVEMPRCRKLTDRRWLCGELAGPVPACGPLAELLGGDQHDDQQQRDDPSGPAKDRRVDRVDRGAGRGKDHGEAGRGIEGSVGQRGRPHRSRAKTQPPEDCAHENAHADHHEHPQPPRSQGVVVAQQDQRRMPG